MNILLMTSPAPEFAPLSTSEKRPPLGVGFLVSVLKREGHKVFFADPYLDPACVPDADFMVRNRIDWVGIYANTLCYQKTLAVLHWLQGLREKKVWSGRIMLGGPHASVGLESVPDCVDHVVIGEGEISIVKIVDGEETSRVIHGEMVPDLDSLPFPAWEEFIHRGYDWTHAWTKRRPVYTFNTSRGCPFQCLFCSVGAVWGRTYRFMSAERILADVGRMIQDYGLRVAYFREDHFTLDRKRTLAFCEGILRREMDFEWMCESRVDSLDDPECVELMARAGCRGLYIGVESGSPRMLEFFRKGERVEQFIKTFDLARKFGIKTYASFIVGAPTETDEDLQLTEQLIQRIRPDFVSRNVYAGLPGSALCDYVREHELHEYEDRNHVLYLKGHDARVDRFYGSNPYLKIPYPARVLWRGRKRSVKRVIQYVLRRVGLQ